MPGETRTTNWYLNAVDLQKDAKAIIKFYDRSGNLTVQTINRTLKHIVNEDISPIVKAFYTNNTMTITGENIESVTIFDLTGRVLYNSEFNNFQDLVIIENLNLAKSLYFVKIISNGKYLVKKVLIM